MAKKQKTIIDQYARINTTSKKNKPDYVPGKTRFLGSTQDRVVDRYKSHVFDGQSYSGVVISVRKVSSDNVLKKFANLLLNNGTEYVLKVRVPGLHDHLPDPFKFPNRSGIMDLYPTFVAGSKELEDQEPKVGSIVTVSFSDNNNRYEQFGNGKILSIIDSVENQVEKPVSGGRSSGGGGGYDNGPNASLPGYIRQPICKYLRPPDSPMRTADIPRPRGYGRDERTSRDFDGYDYETFSLIKNKNYDPNFNYYRDVPLATRVGLELTGINPNYNPYYDAYGFAVAEARASGQPIPSRREFDQQQAEDNAKDLVIEGAAEGAYQAVARINPAVRFGMTILRPNNNIASEEFAFGPQNSRQAALDRRLQRNSEYYKAFADQYYGAQEAVGGLLPFETPGNQYGPQQEPEADPDSLSGGFQKPPMKCQDAKTIEEIAGLITRFGLKTTEDPANAEYPRWPTIFGGIDVNTGKPTAGAGQAGRITSYMQAKRKLTAGGTTITRNHNGIDIGIATGAPLLSTLDGVVVLASNTNTHGGATVVIRHDLGGGKFVWAGYCHLRAILTEKGKTVKKGECIGLSGGKAGDWGAGRSTGAHLHFQIALKRPGAATLSDYIDPLAFLSTKISDLSQVKGGIRNA